MAMATKRLIFISSTAKDLAEFRSAAISRIERLDGWKCSNMERFGARAGRTVDVCKRLVQECDLFLGIVGHLYGSCPKDSFASYTEHEYEAAVTANIPRLMFIAHEGVAVLPELRAADSDPERQIAFRNRVRNSEQMVESFNNPDGLAVSGARSDRKLAIIPGDPPPEGPRRGRGRDRFKTLQPRSIRRCNFGKTLAQADEDRAWPSADLSSFAATRRKHRAVSLRASKTRTSRDHANKVWPAEGVVS